MKKNLNIAYLNGAEGMIRRGGASSGSSGGSGSGEAIQYTYLETKGMLINRIPYFFGTVLRYEGELMGMAGTYYLTYGYLSAMGVSNMENVTAIMIDENMLITDMYTGEGYKTFIELIKQGENSEEYLSLPRITKEQFYSLE